MTDQNNAVPQSGNGEQPTSVLPQYSQPSPPSVGEQPTSVFPQPEQSGNGMSPMSVNWQQNQSGQQQPGSQQAFNVLPTAPGQPDQGNTGNGDRTA